jgi:uncharacterized protein YndB with AHSA1/START domain
MSDYGSVATLDGLTTVSLERHLRHPVERVWRFISEPEHMVAWLAEAEIEPFEGGKVLLRRLTTDEQGDQAVASGVITEYKPPHVLQLDTDTQGRLRWELEGDGSGALLLFTAIGEYADRLAEVLAEWHLHHDFLGEALEGHPVDWPHWPRHRWDTLRTHYLTELRRQP